VAERFDPDMTDKEVAALVRQIAQEITEAFRPLLAHVEAIAAEAGTSLDDLAEALKRHAGLSEVRDGS